MTMAATASITGPVTGGRRGWPFGAAAYDLGRYGYVEDEWFMEGEATTYRHNEDTGRSWDGRWSAEARGKAPYRTRMLVRRPADAWQFNGTVVLMWNNVSLGFEILTGETAAIYQEGFAFVGVGAQRLGLEGYPAAPERALRGWDPDRYGSLSIVSDDSGWDIYTQAARAVGPERSRQPDPLGGLPVERVLAFGVSQSATRLATYLNAIHPEERAVHGFLIDVYFGNGAPLQAPPSPPVALSRVEEVNAAAARMPPGTHLLRDDLGVPIFVVNSETESTRYAAVRQADTDTFRFWEVAGVAHGATRPSPTMLSCWPRDLGIEAHPMAPASGTDQLSMEPVRAAALHQMQRWLTKGEPPPGQAPIAFGSGAASSRVQRDVHGNAKGGVRLPDLDVPTARHSGLGPDDTLAMFGTTVAFDADVLRSLYVDHAAYVDRFERAAAEAVEEGVLLEADAAVMVERARQAPVP
jgi:hypothetical protein